MIMNTADCRRKAESYKKLARTQHQHARKYFQAHELDLAIEAEENAMFFDKLIASYEHMSHQREVS